MRIFRPFRKKSLKTRNFLRHPKETSWIWLTVALFLTAMALLALWWASAASLRDLSYTPILVAPPHRQAAKTPIVAPVYRVVKTVKKTVTAYNPVPQQTDTSPCITANGTDICKGLALGKRYVAANSFPFGTLLRIHGNVYEVVDRSGRPNIVDVAFPAHQVREARLWGRQHLLVDVVQKM
jgi:3D (Asp-Asp-Asp) domain-containing protein